MSSARILQVVLADGRKIDLTALGSEKVIVVLGSTGCTNEPRPPDILLVSVDTLRADHLGLYEYARDTAPNIGR